MRSFASGIFGRLKAISTSTPVFVEYARDMLFCLIDARNPTAAVIDNFAVNP
jgi:hypothetical protein